MLNKAILMGRLTRDPEMRTVGNDTLVANFTLAVNRPKYGDGEQKADFIPIVVWRKTAEFVEKYFKKGMQVYVDGRIQTRSWEDSDGKKRYATDVVANEVGFAESRKKDNGDSNDNAGLDFEPDFGPVGDGDDLPF